MKSCHWKNNIFRLLFNYNDTFGQLLGFSDVGKNTSITQYNHTITNKMFYSPILGLTLDNTTAGININFNKNQAFAKILLNGINNQLKGTNYGDYMGGNIIYNSFVKMKKIYYIPIHEISRLSFEFYTPSGELYDFNGLDHSFTLKITTLENILDNTNINSQTESMI